jgi:hypothetical protein
MDYHYTKIKFDWLVAGILLIPSGEGLVNDKISRRRMFFYNFSKGQNIFTKDTAIALSSGVVFALTASNGKNFCHEGGESENI